jgi:hypothetical protein
LARVIRDQEDREASLRFRIVDGAGLEHADATHAVGQLRARGARPGDCDAAEHGDEFASPHGHILGRGTTPYHILE